jgi:hypothetical protein
VLTVKYQTAPGIVYGDSNVFRLEFSNARGEFDNPRWPGRYVGSLQSKAAKGTIGVIRASDNVDFNPVVATPTYRLRLTSTHPAQASFNIDLPANSYYNCPTRQPKMYASTLRPFKKYYQRGDELEFTIYRDPNTLVLAPSDFIRVQLSDSNGLFRGLNLNTRIVDSATPAFVGDSMVVRFRIPNDVVNAWRYRIRPTITSDPNIPASTSTGHEVSIIGFPVGVSERAKGGLQVWPVPSNGSLKWHLPENAGAVVRASLVSVTAVQYELNPLAQDGNLSHVPPGTYVLKIQTKARSYTAMVVQQ